MRAKQNGPGANGAAPTTERRANELQEVFDAG
jgi:hypothetical protein